MFRRHTVSIAVLVVGATLLLGSCSSGSSDSSSTIELKSTGSTSTTEFKPSSTESTAPSSIPSTSSDPIGTPAAKRCTSPDAPIPAGATSRETSDVDGDGRPDTVWIDTADGSTTVGIRTAAGGGSRIPYESASPTPRSAFVVNADEQGPVEIIVSDGRGASLYAFADCKIQPVLNVQGQTYEFDLQNLRGHGTGIGCIQTDAGRRLVGLQVTDRTDTKVSWTSTVIELAGLMATNGEKRSGTYSLPADKAKAALLDQIACGNQTMSADGVTER